MCKHCSFYKANPIVNNLLVDFLMEELGMQMCPFPNRGALWLLQGQPDMNSFTQVDLLLDLSGNFHDFSQILLEHSLISKPAEI